MCVCLCVCVMRHAQTPTAAQLWPRSVRWHCSGLRRMQRTGGGYRLRLLGMRRVAASRRPLIALPFCCRRLLQTSTGVEISTIHIMYPRTPISRSIAVVPFPWLKNPEREDGRISQLCFFLSATIRALIASCRARLAHMADLAPSDAMEVEKVELALSGESGIGVLPIAGGVRPGCRPLAGDGVANGQAQAGIEMPHPLVSALWAPGRRSWGSSSSCWC